jgi:hypothetical protein
VWTGVAVVPSQCPDAECPDAEDPSAPDPFDGMRARSRRAAGGPGTSVAGHRLRRQRRPVRLTRRGRVVLLAALLVLCGLAAALAAVPGEAADHRSRYSTAVVQPGDTLWSFASRNVPDDDPFTAIREIRRLNGIDGYVIHSGQQLVIPARR